jgi:energy-coupling factor transporter ATP-binding protein EcfA2
VREISGWVSYPSLNHIESESMQITSFEFEDLATGWKLEPVDFGRLNLLVGASGAGKTRIVQALQRVCSIPRTSSLPAEVSWKLEFQLDDEKHIWRGKTQSSDEFELEKRSDPRGFGSKGEIVEEILEREGSTLFTKKGQDVEVFGDELPRMKSDESVLNVIEEEELSRVANVLNRVRAESTGPAVLRKKTLEKVGERFSDFETLVAANLPTFAKLYFAQEEHPGKFNELLSSYSSIFPTVQDIEVLKEVREPANLDAEDSKELVSFEVNVKEEGVEGWIHVRELAGGMRRTLSQLVELHLAPEHRTFLVDEVENSMGVNCLGDMTDQIKKHARHIQFVLTSHHPYIINNIPAEYWRIVTREGSTVKVYNADEIPALTSGTNQSKFTQLLNADFFLEGPE